MDIMSLVNSNPKTAIILIGVGVTFLLTIVTKYTTNQSRLKELKGIQKACQIKIKEAKGDVKKMGDVNKQMMECSMEMMKHSFKPMFITLIPLLVLFWWLKGIFVNTPIASSWIWWYIGSAIISSIFFRKILKVI